MASLLLDASIRTSLLSLSAAALLTGCPDDPVPSVDTDPSSTGPTVTATDGELCMPGETTDCTCPDGTPSTRPCQADGMGFDACECGDADTTVGTDPTVGDDSTTTTGDDSTTGPQPCVTAEDCTELQVGECEVAVCEASGTCVPGGAPLGQPCGDATDEECSDPDSCDGEGTCLTNDLINGAVCSDCASGECTCTAGVCGECSGFPPTNNFITSRSIEGWEFTGSWGLHRQAPQSELAGPSEFVGQLLGSNGNRVEPFPGAEIEASYARTPPTLLADMIVFLSWHVDEGGGLSDNKTVRVSVDDGATWDTLVDCAVDPGWPFCVPSLDQDPAVFNLVQIPVPVPLQGQVGIVEFGYDTVDACCDFEKGWYIDSLNIARECGCVADEQCAAYGTACGTGVCGATGECALMATSEGDACGDAFENDCNGADACDGVGYCRDNLQATGLTPCEDCPSGDTCSYCDAGQCLDCQTFTDFTGFSDPDVAPPWSALPDWGSYTSAPQNEQGVGPTVFPNGPVYGTDGNRSTPYPGGESESSQVITSIGVVPFELIFGSWNVDEGSGYDTKRIDISVNGGGSWTVLEDCDAGSTQPFCDYVDDTRAIDDWDAITLDTSPWYGMNGQLRFSYVTGDSCCSFERGWYLDFSYAICDDIAFP
jgi:hypothetical protein